MITDEQVQTVMDILNNRPGKTIGFKTPNEVFLGIKFNLAAAYRQLHLLFESLNRGKQCLKKQR